MCQVGGGANQRYLYAVAGGTNTAADAPALAKETRAVRLRRPPARAALENHLFQMMDPRYRGPLARTGGAGARHNTS